MSRIPVVLLVIVGLVIFQSRALWADPSVSVSSNYYRTLAFRESPYAPHKGIHPISADQARTVNHYRFDHDELGRLVRIDFALGEQLRRANHTSNYFWYASSEQYAYAENRVEVRYQDQWGEPTTVMGRVHLAEYTLDEKGRRTALAYFDENLDPVENRWGIHRYQFTAQEDGSVLESRFDLIGMKVSLRPGFDFQDVRISYDQEGYTRLMQFVDQDGNLTATADGFSQDRFSYSPEGELVRYEVLDVSGQRTNNHAGVAGGTTEYTPEGYEQSTRYFDVDGAPVPTDYGWWRSYRAYDQFGNLRLNAFEGLNGRPLNNPNTGYAKAVIEWHEDGLRRRSFRYFDERGLPVNHASRGFHQVAYFYGSKRELTESVLADTEGRIVQRPDHGWALTRYVDQEAGKTPQSKRFSLEQLKKERLDNALSDLQAISHVPGLAAAIAIDGEVVWQGGAGHADLVLNKPVEADTVFRLASVSKAVTSILVARALENQFITLDDRASDLLPVNHSASLRQLLAHTGSVSHYSALTPRNLDAPYDSSIEALGTVEPHLLSIPPGTEYIYSTFGYTLAGAMLEAAVGVSLPLQLGQLADELGTESLAAPFGNYTNPDLTRFYEISRQGPETARERDFSYSFAGAGMVANAGDLARLASRFATASIVSAGTRDTLLQAAHFADGTPVEDQRYRVGLGWRVQQGPGDKPWYHHAGVTDGARTVVAIEPNSGIAVVLLGNARWTADMFGTVSTLVNLYLSTPRLPEHPQEVAIDYEGQLHPLVSDSCSGIRCALENSGDGALNQWLGAGGMDSGFTLVESAGARYLLTSYGLAWFSEEEARIGSKVLTLKTAGD